MHLPGASEALAEVALLSACAEMPQLHSAPCVYSYRLFRANESSGVFVPYVAGLRKRHHDIAAACKANPTGIVQYTDIKQYYPSITKEVISQIWSSSAANAGLARRYADLGHKLLIDHARVARTAGGGLLTGPVLSHFMANLVLHTLDAKLSRLPVGYFRYVDDIALVGDRDAVVRATELLRDELDALGLALHEADSAKSMTIPCSEWLAGEADFDETPDTRSWAALIGDVKRLLLLKPNVSVALVAALREIDVRLPLSSFASSVRERTFAERVLQLTSLPWFQQRLRRLSVASIVERAKSLRARYTSEAFRLLGEFDGTRGYERKRRVPRLRYRLGRLVYLADRRDLGAIAKAAAQYKETAFLAAVMSAVASGDGSDLLLYGSNAVQSAAQAIVAGPGRLSIGGSARGDVRLQGIAILAFNGVAIEEDVSEAAVAASSMCRLAIHGSDVDLMTSRDAFIRELACLHGIAAAPRHAATLATAFDDSEEVVFDALQRIDLSGSA